MKITGFGIQGPQTTRETKKTSRSRSSSSRSKSSQSVESDVLELSDHASAMELIRQVLDATPDVRMEEVERVMNELKSGKYRIHYEKVAQGFMREAIVAELGRRKKVSSKAKR